MSLRFTLASGLVLICSPQVEVSAQVDRDVSTPALRSLVAESDAVDKAARPAEITAASAGRRSGN